MFRSPRADLSPRLAALATLLAVILVAPAARAASRGDGLSLPPPGARVGLPWLAPADSARRPRLAATFATSPASGDLDSRPAPDYWTAPWTAVGNAPAGLAPGDFDEDGRLDLAVSVPGDQRLLLLRGAPAAALQVWAERDVPGGPSGIVAADFDGDGHLDVGISRENGPGGMQILLGDGAGGFTDGPTFLAGMVCRRVAAGDLNGDGAPDLVATVDGWPATVAVVESDGLGGYRAPQSYEVGLDPLWASVADLDRDGHPDLLVTSWACNDVFWLRNDGSGGFAPAVGIGVPGPGQAAACADFLGDGEPVLAVANGRQVSFLKRVHGFFSTFASYDVGASTAQVAAVDLDHDGRPDVVCANYDGNDVSVLYNDGDGTFRPDLGYGVWDTPVCVAAGDFDGDGSVEIATTDYYSSVVSLLRRGPDGTFRARRDYPAGWSAYAMATGDFNGDGRLDVAVADYARGEVAVALHDIGRTFEAPRAFPVGAAPRSIATADLDGDGALDLVTADQNDDAVTILYGTGDGGFGDRYDLPAGTEPMGLALGDVNDDGVPDLVVADHAHGAWGPVAVIINDGARGFPTGAFFLTGPGPTGVALADLDGDGHQDIVATNYEAASITVLHGHGNGVFDAARDYATPSGPWSVTAAGVFRGPVPDLVVANRKGTTISVFENDGAGGFGGRVDLEAGANPSHVAVADLDGDGWPDLAATIASQNLVAVFMNEGSGPRGVGSFSGPSVFATGPTPESLVAGDFTSDALPDLCVASRDGGMLSLLRTGTDPGAVAVPPGAPVATLAFSPPRPNPTRGGADLLFAVPESGRVRLRVHDVAGRLVATLLDRDLPAGRRQASWDGTDAAGARVRAGLYFVRLDAGACHVTRRLVVTR